MNRARVSALPIACTLFLFTLSGGCDYGRMYDQDAIRTYGRSMPSPDSRTIPVEGGFEVLKAADAAALLSPVAHTQASVAYGRQAYAYFCVQCHGLKADGRGTVGQSFAPLPAVLSSRAVQAQTDGELYAKIRLGFKRHPKLFTTVSDEDTWAVVTYIRSLRGGG